MQHHQLKIKSTEKMKTSEENVFQKVFSLVVPDDFLNNKKSRESRGPIDQSLDQCNTNFLNFS